MAVVITHPEFGIYLGSFFGLGFWSKLDAAGQPAAITFNDPEEAQAAADTWEQSVSPLTFVDVEPDDGEYITDRTCALFGLEPWLIETAPVADAVSA